MMRAQTFLKLLLVILFFLLISGPLVVYFFQDVKNISVVEKRSLALKPSLPSDARTLINFPNNFEKYYNDHFGFRDSFLYLYTLSKRVIGDTAGVNISKKGGITRNVIKGKEGWYFLNRIWDGDPISDYRNIDLYSQIGLFRTAISYAARKHWLENQGIAFILVIAPNKHTIYSEYLPDYIVKQNSTSSMDQLYGVLEKYTSVQFVDLRDTLIQGKAETKVYWKTDSHWNGVGADLVQHKVTEKIAQMIPGTKKASRWPPEKFIMRRLVNGDLAMMINDKSLFDEKGPVFMEPLCARASWDDYKKNKHAKFCREGKVNAIILHDSFFTIPLQIAFSDYFSTTYFTWEKFSQNNLEKYIKEYKPKIILEEFAERFLPYVPDINSEIYNDFWASNENKWNKEVYRLDNKNFKQKKLENVVLKKSTNHQVVNLQALNEDPQIYLTDIPFSKNQLYLLKIKIETQKDTLLQVFYSNKEEKDNFPSEALSLRSPLKKGKNTVYLPLFSGNLEKVLRFDPGKSPGMYKINEFVIKGITDWTKSGMWK